LKFLHIKILKKAVLSKVQEKSHLNYTFAQKLSCQSPKGMAAESSEVPCLRPRSEGTP